MSRRDVGSKVGKEPTWPLTWDDSRVWAGYMTCAWLPWRLGFASPWLTGLAVLFCWGLLALLRTFVQSVSCVRLCDPMDCTHQPSLSFTISRSLLKPMSIELGMPSNHLTLCHLLFLPLIFPSIRVFSNELTLCIKWPKYWNFSFSISPSNECSGLVSFRMDWFNLHAVQGALQNLLQCHSSKIPISWLRWTIRAHMPQPRPTTASK